MEISITKAPSSDTKLQAKQLNYLVAIITSGRRNPAAAQRQAQTVTKKLESKIWLGGNT